MEGGKISGSPVLPANQQIIERRKLSDTAKAIARTTLTTQEKSIALELTHRYLGYGARYLKNKRDGQS